MVICSQKINYINVIKYLFFLSFSLCFIIKGLISLFFFFLSLVGILFFFSKKDGLNLKAYDYIFIILMLLNFLSIPINQINLQYFNIKDYDYGVRFILSIFIYLYITRIKLNLNKEIIFGSILSIIFVALSFFFFYKNEVFGVRVHTKFVDPNTLSIYLSIFLLILLPHQYTNNLLRNIIFLIVFLLGIYLAIESRSRGGWLGLAVALLFLITTAIKNKNYFLINVIGSLFIGFFLYYIFSDTFHERFNSIGSDLSGRISGNPNTSTGDRITLIFLGLDMIKNNYLFGINYAESREIIQLMGLHSKYQSHIFDIFYCCGFHNQFITILIKYGFFGLIIFLSLFIYILYLNIKYKNYFSLKIISVVICYLVSSISLETISLKYTQSIFLLLLVYGYS